MKFLLKIFVFMAIILVGKFTKEEKTEALVIQAPPQKAPSLADDHRQKIKVQVLGRDQDKLNPLNIYSF